MRLDEEEEVARARRSSAPGHLPDPAHEIEDQTGAHARLQRLIAEIEQRAAGAIGPTDAVELASSLEEAGAELRRIADELAATTQPEVETRAGATPATGSLRLPLADLVSALIHSEFRGEIDERGVRVVIDRSLPRIGKGQAELEEVIRRLVAGALERIGSRGRPELQVGSARRADATVAWITDNGIPTTPSPLASYSRSVDELVERWGGKAWAYDDHDGTTTVFFTLPPSGYHEIEV